VTFSIAHLEALKQFVLISRMRKSSRKRSTLSPLPSLLAEMPTEAQRSSGKVMTGSWRDPTDTAPSASRTTKEKGWRQPCMLRWCRARHKDRSPFTAEHVVAADELRRVWDLVNVGMNGKPNPWLYYEALHLPKAGPTRPEMQRYRAWKELGRVRKQFSDRDWDPLGWFALANLSIGKWIEKERAAGRQCYQQAAIAKLVEMLDTLVEHFGDVLRRADLSLVA
jgi:hypothetical protein